MRLSIHDNTVTEVASTTATAETVLRVEGLRTEFAAGDRAAVAVDGVSFDVKRGETLAIVGESGSGKSVTSLSMLRLIPEPPGRITAGSVWYKGQDLMTLSERQVEAIRGAEIAMIFQEPMPRRWRCCPRSAFPSLHAAFASILISFPGACCSG